MKASIEKRKAAGGRVNLRIVYYYGSTKDDTGKLIHNRKREKLDLFLYEKPRTAIEKQHNKETIQLAEAIKAKRMVEHQSGKHHFKIHSKSEGESFFQLYEKLIGTKKREITVSAYSVWDSAYKQLRKFETRPDLLIDDITSEFVKDFKNYLQNEATTKSGQKISRNTANSYFNKFRSVVKEAYRRGLVLEDPLADVKTIQPENNKREYLEVSELKSLVATPCRNEVLRRAFLFSCLTGLRWSDINKLVWSEIVQTDSGNRIVFNQQKTKGLQYLDLSEQAYSLFGEKQADRVFYGLKYSSYNNTDLLKWCRDAGITKHITFHSGRHTFAVTQLTNGADIYTLSKLLGHSELKTTQIYADIIDARRKQAMHQMPDIGL